MPTTILDGETYEQALHRRFTEEAKAIEKMQQDEIIRMAEKACQPHQILNTDLEFLMRFAALVAAHEREKCFDAAMKSAEKAVDAAMLLEREACAKVCDDKHDYMCSRAAEAIRARGEK